MKNLSCINCGEKIDIFEVFNVKPKEVYYCKKCNEPQEPVFNPYVLMTWNHTPIFGFITTVVPILVINIFLNDRWLSFAIGAIVAVLIYAFYLIIVTKTTKFQ